MKRRIQVFIEPVIDSGDYLQLELFNDEQIVVNSVAFKTFRTLAKCLLTFRKVSPYPLQL
jgi:hypothetical protein